MHNLTELRLKMGKTQEDMAKVLKIGVSSYNQYENSQRNVPLDVAEQIADIFNLKVEEIFLPIRFTVSKNTKKMD